LENGGEKSSATFADQQEWRYFRSAKRNSIFEFCRASFSAILLLLTLQITYKSTQKNKS